MAEAQTNLRMLKRSRTMPQTGDVFAMHLPDETYLFGRVVGADLDPPNAPMPGAYLIYVYSEIAVAKESPETDRLTPDRLLIPPLFINRMPWAKEYFETVAASSLTDRDVLPQSCFRDWNGDFIDGRGNKLPGPVEPCGQFSLFSYRWLDDQISDALGIPRVPED